MVKMMSVCAMGAVAAAGCSSALCSAWLENRWAATAVKIGRPIAGLLIVSAGVFVLWAAL